MKKIIPLIMLLLISITSSAQLFKPKDKTPADAKYLIGAVPIENGSVVFRDTIEAPGMDAKKIISIAKEWHKTRFVEPTVISTKIIKGEEASTFEIKAEEYIVFTKKFLVLNRARIYYFLTINATDGKCEVIMSRISYWQDDEHPDGGHRYTAEDIITDEKALDESKIRFKKNPGRFRTKTIDLKDNLVNELKNKLTAK